MATINARSDILDRTKIMFDVRAYYRNTGDAMYARAITPIYGESVHLKFATYDQPTPDVLQAWSKIPIQIDENARPKDVNCGGVVNWSVTPLTNAEDRQALLNKSGEALSQTMKKVTSALISMRFGAYNKFAENPLSSTLLMGAVDLCKNAFPAMDPNESTVIVHAGRESYHYDNLLDEDLNRAKLNICFAPKHPNQNSQIGCLARSGTLEKLTEEKKD